MTLDILAFAWRIFIETNSATNGEKGTQVNQIFVQLSWNTDGIGVLSLQGAPAEFFSHEKESWQCLRARRMLINSRTEISVEKLVPVY